MNKFVKRTLIILTLFVFAFGISFKPASFGVFAKPGDGAAVELSVDKFNVTPDYNIVYEWTLQKTASPALLELAAGGSGQVTYTVSAVKTQTSTFSLTYNVTVLNKGPGSIQTDIIASIQNPSGSVNYVTETVENDLIVADGATFTKQYTTTFEITGNIADITPLKVVVALADTVNVGSIKVSGTQAAINFKDTPTSVFNESITVTDSWSGAGPWTFNATGSYQYMRTFNAGAIGDVYVDNTVTSNTLMHHVPAVLTDSAQVTVRTLNTAPIANPGSFNVNEGATHNGTLSGSDPDGQSISFFKVSDPAHGLLTVNDDGTFSYVHDGSETTSDSFTFRVFDGFAYSSSATVTITVNPVNDAPTANPGSFNVNEGGTYNGTLTGSDPEGDELTFFVVTNPLHGSLLINQNGTFTYIHNGSETVSDSFTFRVYDGDLYSSAASVTITINPVNDGPIANPDSFNVNEGATHNGTLTGSDPENDALTFFVVSNPAHGLLVINPDGTFSYVHDGSETVSDSFTFRVYDGELYSSAATVTITINPVNDAPTADDDAFTVDQGESYSGQVTGSDPEDDELTFIVVVGPLYGELVLNSDGTFTYIHDNSENYTDSFTFKVNDGLADSNIATVTIEINATLPAENAAPVADDFDFDVDQGKEYNGMVTGSDEDGDEIIFILVSGPAYGELIFNADGTFTYIHDNSENYEDSFTFKVNDGEADSEIATVTILINATLPDTSDNSNGVIGIGALALGLILLLASRKKEIKN